jgi:hypothetical protein
MTREGLITETVDAVAQGQSPGDTGAVLAADLQEQPPAQNPLNDPAYAKYFESLRNNANSY